jgi:hypothetical protein
MRRPSRKFEDAVYPQKEIEDMPLTVFSHLGEKDVAFRKVDGNNCDQLFRDNGNLRRERSICERRSEIPGLAIDGRQRRS